MFKFLLFLILIVGGVLAFLWFGSQSLPGWYEEESTTNQKQVAALVNKIEREGTAQFLGDKFADVMRGKVVLDEDEFNALLLASLARHKDGRRLLQVSDVVRADLRAGEIELAAIIDLEKVQEIEPKARKTLREVRDYLPFALDEKVFVAITAEPVARNGGVGVSENISLQIGAVPISATFLRRAGVPIDRLKREFVPLRNLNIQDIQTRDGELELRVLPKF